MSPLGVGRCRAEVPGSGWTQVFGPGESRLVPLSMAHPPPGESGADLSPGTEVLTEVVSVLRGLGGERWNALTRLRTTKGESTEQDSTCQSRASVRWSKRIRYPRSPRCKPCLPRMRAAFLRNVSPCLSPATRNPSVWVQGGVRLQDWNLKELTEWHHKAWSLRLNLTQHGERYLDSTWKGYDRLKHSLR